MPLLLPACYGLALCKDFYVHELIQSLAVSYKVGIIIITILKEKKCWDLDDFPKAILYYYLFFDSFLKNMLFIDF